MQDSFIIRNALPSEAKILSALAVRSKAYWGYSDEFMQACVEELTVYETDIQNPGFYCVLAERGDKIAGFYTLEDLTRDEVELGALFVEPAHIGTGIGRALIEAAKNHARNLGAQKLIVQGDPNACRFYEAAGGIPTGERESASINGRFLPTYEIPLQDK